MKPILILAALSGFVCANNSCDCALLCGCGHDGPSSSPISVMGDHLHPEGEWMVSIRHMYMDMDGMYRGSSPASTAMVHGANYVVSPTRMTMEMQMLGVMYAPSDDFSLMVMLPYVESEMDHVIEAGTPLVGLNGGSTTFTTHSSGMGDLKLSALLRLLDEDRCHLHGGIGVSLPTGSISETDLIPGPGGLLSRQLPAAMQPGSGTIDLLPSLTYLYEADGWSTGIQARGVIRTGENHHDYRLGHRAELDAWIGCKPVSWLAVTSGLGCLWEGELHGTQSDLSQNPPFAPLRRTVPTAFGENYGGARLDMILGINALLSEDQRIGLDLRLPLWQEVHGQRLGQDLATTIGWQISF